jgi:hypothetical protein
MKGRVLPGLFFMQLPSLFDLSAFISVHLWLMAFPKDYARNRYGDGFMV